jgi:hypothetical protein
MAASGREGETPRHQLSCSESRAAIFSRGWASGDPRTAKAASAAFLGRRRIGQKPGQVEPVDFVGLGRGPQTGVLKDAGHEVDDGVPERVADAGRIAAGSPEIGEIADRVAGQPFPVLPHPQQGPPGFGLDLVPGPGLEVDLFRGLDAFAPVDLPGIGLVVSVEGLGVEKVEHVPVERGVRPGLFLQEADRGLVAVEGGAELDLLDEGPGPEGLVAAAPGFRPQLGGLVGRRFVFLFLLEPLDRLAAAFLAVAGVVRRTGPGRGRRERRGGIDGGRARGPGDRKRGGGVSPPAAPNGPRKKRPPRGGRRERPGSGPRPFREIRQGVCSCSPPGSDILIILNLAPPGKRFPPASALGTRTCGTCPPRPARETFPVGPRNDRQRTLP